MRTINYSSKVLMASVSAFLLMLLTLNTAQAEVDVNSDNWKSVNCRDDYSVITEQTFCVILKSYYASAETAVNAAKLTADFAVDSWDQVESTWVSVTAEVNEEGEKTLLWFSKATHDTLETINIAFQNSRVFGERVLRRLDLAWEAVDYQIQGEYEDIENFVGDTGCDILCEQLREDLLALVQEMGDLTNVLLTFEGSGNNFLGSVDTSPLQGIDFTELYRWIDDAPGVTLYPIYKSFKLAGSQALLVNTADQIYQVKVSVALLQDVVKAPRILTDDSLTKKTRKTKEERMVMTSSIEEFDGDAFCDWVGNNDNRNAVDFLVPSVQVAATGMHVLGGMMMAFSKINTDSIIGVGAGAEAGIKISVNITGLLGTMISSMADVAVDVANIAGSSITSCDIQEIKSRVKDKA